MNTAFLCGWYCYGKSNTEVTLCRRISGERCLECHCGCKDNFLIYLWPGVSVLKLIREIFIIFNNDKYLPDKRVWPNEHLVSHENPCARLRMCSMTSIMCP